MRLSISYTTYVFASVGALVGLLLVSFATHEGSYLALSFLSTARISLAIIYNFLFLALFGTSRLLLRMFLGRLRELEIEQVLEAGRGFLMDTVMFLFLSSPTINGQEVATLGLIQFVSFIVVVKVFHLICQIRIAHLFEVGVPQTGALGRLLLFMLVLLGVDYFSAVQFHSVLNGQSSLYLWLLFECIGMITSAAMNLMKFSFHFIDSQLDNGWPSKTSYIFFVDLLSDILSLCVSLTFMVLFIINYPTRLPIHMISDILQIMRTLFIKSRSFKRYRLLIREMSKRFPDATFEELEESDTCIICRDILTFQSKKLPCSHIFHTECLKAWFVQQQSCPTCRADVILRPSSLSPAVGSITPPPEPAEGQRGETEGPLGAANVSSDLLVNRREGRAEEDRTSRSTNNTNSLGGIITSVISSTPLINKLITNHESDQDYYNSKEYEKLIKVKKSHRNRGGDRDVSRRYRGKGQRWSKERDNEGRSRRDRYIDKEMEQQSLGTDAECCFRSSNLSPWRTQKSFDEYQQELSNLVGQMKRAYEMSDFFRQQALQWLSQAARVSNVPPPITTPFETIGSSSSSSSTVIPPTTAPFNFTPNFPPTPVFSGQSFLMAIEEFTRLTATPMPPPLGLNENQPSNSKPDQAQNEANERLTQSSTAATPTDPFNDFPESSTTLPFKSPAKTSVELQDWQQLQKQKWEESKRASAES